MKKGPTPRPVGERLWEKVDKSGDCWLWLGWVMPNGYGTIRNPGGTSLVHRIAYELERGPIPAGLTIDHLCRTRNCVRVDHLEPVPISVNTRRAADAKTHCINGHPYVDGNIHVNSLGRRSCMECRRQAARRSAARKREAAA